MVPSGGNGLIASNLCRKGWANDEQVRREPRPVGIGANLEKNRRTRGLARGNPQQNAQAHQGSRPGRRRGVEVDGHSDLVARRHHLHWRILQECREAYLRQGRVSEGSGPSLQLESRRERTSRDRQPRRRRSGRVRLQGARSPSGRPQQFWQVETFEESEVLRDSAPEQVRHRGGGGVVPPERTQVEDGLDSRKERIVGILDPARRVRRGILRNLGYQTSPTLLLQNED